MKKYTRVKNIVQCKSIVSSIVCDVCGKVIEQCNNYHEVSYSYSKYVGQDVYTKKVDVCLDCAPSYAHSLISIDDVVSYSDKLEYANYNTVGGENTTNLNVIDFRENLISAVRSLRDNDTKSAAKIILDTLSIYDIFSFE